MTRPKSTERVKKAMISTASHRDFKVGENVRVVYEDGPILNPEEDYPVGSKQDFSVTTKTEVTNPNGEKEIVSSTKKVGTMEVTESDTHGAKGIILTLKK